MSGCALQQRAVLLLTLRLGPCVLTVAAHVQYMRPLAWSHVLLALCQGQSMVNIRFTLHSIHRTTQTNTHIHTHTHISIRLSLSLFHHQFM